MPGDNILQLAVVLKHPIIKRRKLKTSKTFGNIGGSHELSRRAASLGQAKTRTLTVRENVATRRIGKIVDDKLKTGRRHLIFEASAARVL
jgi:hypothetical protein